MNNAILGVALAFFIGVGAGYGVFTAMSDTKVPAEVAATQAAAVAPEEVANVEPAAADAKIDVKKPMATKDNPVVARVDGQEILRSDVKEFLKTLPPQYSQAKLEDIFPMALEQVVNAKIVDEKVGAANVTTTPEYAERLSEAKTQIGRAVYVENEINKKFSDSAAKKMYDEMVAKMPKTDEAKASHILVDSEAQAKDIIAKLDSGAKFADLAKEFSKDKANSANGGDLGYFAKGDMVKEFGDAAFAMSKGDHSKSPVKTQFGFHVIQLDDKRVRPAPAFDEMKPQLEAQVRRQILEDLVKGLRESAKVEMFDIDGKPVQKAESKEAPKAGAEQPKATN
ncbi:MAG: peptidylprolyl isomerase [Pseudobdellovibrionaceae bacterium]